MKRPNSTLFSLTLLALIASCMPLERQDQSDVFVSEHLEELDQIANPLPDSVTQAHEQRLAVAVIDSGVDYLHPKLRSQIEFQTDNKGQITGAGLDLLGNDQWPYPFHLRTNIFAFGAQDIQAGKIVGPLANPLEQLAKLNDSYVQMLMDKIATHPILKDTLYRKINHSSMSLFGHLTLNSAEEDGHAMQEFERLKAKGKLLPHQKSKVKGVTQGNLRAIYDWHWILDESKGMPYDQPLNQFEHFDVYNQVAQEVYVSFNQQYKFEEQVKALLAYETNAETLSEVKDIDLKTSLGSLAESLYSYYRDYRFKPSQEADRSLFHIQWGLCRTASEENYRQLQSQGLSPEGRKLLTQATLEDMFSQLEKMNSFAYKRWIDEKGKDALDIVGTSHKTFLKNNKKYLPLFKQKAQELMAQNKWQLNCAQAWPSNALAKLNQDHLPFLPLSPYLNKSIGGSQSHGTHVSGIIAVQHPKVSIYPVRLITESIDISSAKEQQLKTEFIADFQAWLDRYPQVWIVIQKKLAQMGLGFNRAQLIEKIEASMEEDKDFAFNYNFIDQMEQAIIDIGAKQIKMANMSLGMNHDKKALLQPDVTKLKEVDEFIAFLKFELYKYKLGTAIKQKAAGTLFVIASGNDGQWLDGNARSGIPCDLSSPFFKEGMGNNNLPNNQITNILCVGSIDRNDEISSFTNLPLTQVPFVLSYGEGVYSTLIQADCQQMNHHFAQKFGQHALQNPLLQDVPNELKLYLTEQKLIDATQSEELQQAQVKELTEKFRNQDMYLLTGLHDTLKLKNCRENVERIGYMTGTSMATPSVAGFIARRLIEETSKPTGLKGLKFTQPNFNQKLYTDPAFAPAEIIKLILSQSPQYNRDNILKSVKKIIDIRNHLPSNTVSVETQHLAMQQLLKEAQLAAETQILIFAQPN